MNAYELADKLQMDKAKALLYVDTVVQSAEMLRQQADRIAELEKQGEPVAWMQMHYKDNIPTKFSPVKVWEDDIPLYTTPQTKPLSDEEIAMIWKKEWQGGNIGHIAYTYARAIEERHGIK